MSIMTDVNVQRLFPGKQCLFPVVTDSTIWRLAARHNLSDAQLGQQLRCMLAPVHFTCVPDNDLRANPPCYTNFDPIQHLSLDGDSYIRAKDLSHEDLSNMSDAEAAYKQFLCHRKCSLPYGWWDLPHFIYKHWTIYKQYCDNMLKLTAKCIIMYLHRESKKGDTILLSISLLNIDRFS